MTRSTDDPGRRVRPTPCETPARPRRIGLFAIVAVVALALDVVSKVLVVDEPAGRPPPTQVLGGAFYLDQARNSGAAFSLGTGLHGRAHRWSRSRSSR